MGSRTTPVRQAGAPFHPSLKQVTRLRATFLAVEPERIAVALRSPAGSLFKVGTAHFLASGSCSGCSRW